MLLCSKVYIILGRRRQKRFAFSFPPQREGSSPVTQVSVRLGRRWSLREVSRVTHALTHRRRNHRLHHHCRHRRRPTTPAATTPRGLYAKRRSPFIQYIITLPSRIRTFAVWWQSSFEQADRYVVAHFVPHIIRVAHLRPWWWAKRYCVNPRHRAWTI